MYRVIPLSKDYNYLEYSGHTVSIIYFIVQNRKRNGPTSNDWQPLWKSQGIGPNIKLKACHNIFLACYFAAFDFTLWFWYEIKFPIMDFFFFFLAKLLAPCEEGLFFVHICIFEF